MCSVSNILEHFLSLIFLWECILSYSLNIIYILLQNALDTGTTFHCDAPLSIKY